MSKQIGSITTKKSTTNLVNVVNTRCLSYWRLRHLSSEVLSYLPNTLGVVHNTKGDVCEICLRAKQTRSKFPISQNNAKEIFNLIHCDIWGPYGTASLCGAHYFLSIIDDGSRDTWLYLMKDRGEARKLLKGFITVV